LIVTQDASVIIGRGGTHVNEIRVSSFVSSLALASRCFAKYAVYAGESSATAFNKQAGSKQGKDARANGCRKRALQG
jgi:hypothetical protein